MTTYAQSRARAARLPQSLTAQRVDTLIANSDVDRRVTDMESLIARYEAVASSDHHTAVGAAGLVGAQIVHLIPALLADLRHALAAEAEAHRHMVQATHEAAYSAAMVVAADRLIVDLLVVCVNPDRDSESVTDAAVRHLHRPTREVQAAMADAAAVGRSNVRAVA